MEKGDLDVKSSEKHATYSMVEVVVNVQSRESKTNWEL
jgi:hypothetical protein